MADSPVPTRIAVIGAGYWGKNLVRCFHSLGALATVCDADPEQRERMARDYPGVAVTDQVAAVLADPAIRGVAIATPAESHGRLVLEALRAGKDVMVEKPLCLEPAEGRTLVDFARQQGRILMVGHILWYHPAALKLKELVESGALGRLQYLYSNRLNLGKIRREENILWSFAPHDVSLMLGLLNEMPVAVQSQGGCYLHPHIADVTVSLLQFASGVRAHIFVSWLHPFKEQKLVVVGDRQMVVFDDQEPQDKLMLYPHSITWKDQQPVPHKAQGVPVPVAATEPLLNECEHFLSCLITRATPRTDGEEGLRTLTVLQRCQQALDLAPAPATTSGPAAPPAYQAHPTAIIDPGVTIGAGTKIWHFSHILPGTRIGERCNLGQNVVVGPQVSIGNDVKIQNNVSVYQGVTLEDAVFCGPSMVFTNVINPRSEIRRMGELRPTLVRRGATLGANCTIVCGLTIGQYALVGAGAVVTHDVPDFAVVVGNPARPRGWVCACGVKLTFAGPTATCTCGQRYQRADKRLTRLDAVPATAGSAQGAGP